MLDVLRVQEGEPGELVLVEVHHKELVGGGEVRLLGGELLVEVADVLAVALHAFEEKRRPRSVSQLQCGKKGKGLSFNFIL